METDNVLEHSPGVPGIAGGATIPFTLGRRNRLAEPSTHRQMQFGYAVIHGATAG
jgi:hypothetical protein